MQVAIVDLDKTACSADTELWIEQSAVEEAEVGRQGSQDDQGCRDDRACRSDEVLVLLEPVRR